jgi:hypothetical protein
MDGDYPYENGHMTGEWFTLISFQLRAEAEYLFASREFIGVSSSLLGPAPRFRERLARKYFILNRLTGAQRLPSAHNLLQAARNLCIK